MNNKTILTTLTVLFTLILSACVAPAPVAPAPAAAEVSAEEGSVAVAEVATGDPATFTVETAASDVIWGGSNIVGHEQSGTLDIAQGSLEFIGTTLTGGSITIDMSTLTVTSMGGDQANTLHGHLTGEDFFDTAAYPISVITFKSAEATDIEGSYLVTADLTIKDVTDEMTFYVDVTVTDGALSATADIEFDRTQWGVIYGSNSFFDGLGDRVINDEVSMSVTLVANQG